MQHIFTKAVLVYNNQTIRQQPEFTLIRLSDDSELFVNVFLNVSLVNEVDSNYWQQLMINM